MEDVLGLIRKLLALSKSPNEHEAALAMSKAQELLLKHNLDMAEVNTAESKQETEMINESVDFDDFKPWQSTLLNVISLYNFVHIIQIDGRAHEYHILGRRTNVAGVVELYNWIEPQIIRLAATSGYKRTDKASYCQGIVSTVMAKLRDSRNAYTDSHPRSTAIVVDVQRDSDAWYKCCYPHTTTGHQRFTVNGAYTDGKSAGHGVSVYGGSRQVNSGRLMLA